MSADGSMACAPKYARWTPAEDDILRAVYPDRGSQGCSVMLPARKRAGIVKRAQVLGLSTSVKPPKPPPRKTIWSAGELEILDANYAEKGCKGCLSLLPGKSFDQIAKKAQVRGLKSRIQHRASKHPATPEIDAAIRRFWSNPVKCGSLEPFAKSIRRPPWWVQRRAGMLGVVVVRLKERDWTDQEVEILTENAAYGVRTVQRRLKSAGYQRSENSIAIKRIRLGINMDIEREVGGLYSQGGVTRILGVADDTVRRWIRMGYLKGRQRPNCDANQLEIKRDDLRRFIAAHPHAIDLRRVDRELFLDMAFGDCL